MHTNILLPVSVLGTKENGNALNKTIFGISRMDNKIIFTMLREVIEELYS